MEFPTPRYALQAHFLFPVDRAPIAKGFVVINDTQIESVSTTAPDIETIDLGNVAIIPGLVNAHVHLEFSGLQQPLGFSGIALPDWIQQVLDYRTHRGAALADDILAGIEQTIQHGTTSLGEIATSDVPPDWESPAIDLVAFRELICLAEEDQNRIADCIDRHLAAAVRAARWHAGISPHAPYTCLTSTISLAADASRRHQVPLAIHLAESKEEIEWMKTGRGPLGDLLADRGVNPWTSPVTPADVLHTINGAYRTLIIHGNYLQDDEIDAIGQASDLSVVYCPRTHSFFQHDDYPLPRMLAAEINVALGTDGRASNPDLSLLSELRHVADRHPSIAPATVLRMGTLAGATALGIETRTGSITPGKNADLTVVALPDAETSDPHDLLLHNDLPVKYTIARGKRIN